MKTRALALAATLGASLLCMTAAKSAPPAASPSPMASATAMPSPSAADAAVEARAKEWLHRLQTGNIDRTQLDAKVNSALTPAVVTQTATALGALGDPQTFTFLLKKQLQNDMTAYVYRVTFKSAAYNEVFVLDKSGKIAGIQLPPAQ